MKNVIIIGAGGHAKVIADIVIKSGDNVLGFLDDNVELINKNVINDLKVLGKISSCYDYARDNYFIIGIGNNQIRRKIYEKYNDLNYYTAIHKSAVIGLDVSIDCGTVVMANACINSGTKIGKHCIINTSSIVEHDNILHDFVHISPNATLGGTVNVHECTHVGIGATIKNNITIKENNVIGAGAVVVKDILDSGCTYIGVPAKKIDKGEN